MIDVLLQPLAFGFMQKAFIIGLIISVPTAFLSCFLIVKGWSLMGDAISHAILPGVVLAYLL
ncbi:MAG: metal ABC transporter permease, partial [Candidatus Puniceispirillaceae bacterium]